MQTTKQVVREEREIKKSIKVGESKFKTNVQSIKEKLKDLENANFFEQIH